MNGQKLPCEHCGKLLGSTRHREGFDVDLCAGCYLKLRHEQKAINPSVPGDEVVFIDGAFVGTSVVIRGILGIVDKAQLRDLKNGQSVVVTVPLDRLYVRAEGELRALEVEVTGAGITTTNGRKRELILTVKR